MKLFLLFPPLALHEVNNLLRLSNGIIFCRRANDHIGAVEQNHRRGDALAFGIWDDLRLTVSIYMRYGREGRAEVNADCFSWVHFWRSHWGRFTRSFLVQLSCRVAVGFARIHPGGQRSE